MLQPIRLQCVEVLIQPNSFLNTYLVDHIDIQFRKTAIFHPTRRSLLPRRPGWMDNFPNFFLSGLKEKEQRGKKCNELRGEHVE